MALKICPILNPRSMFRTSLFGKFHQLVRVLTNEALLMVAGNIVPNHSISIEIVKNCYTGLVMLQAPVTFPSLLPSLTSEPDQNHPFTIGGCRSARSHPGKLHFRPEVQKNRIAPSIIRCLRKSFSSLVSIDTRSMQCLLQMFLPVTQSTLRSSVKSYSQEKK